MAAREEIAKLSGMKFGLLPACLLITFSIPTFADDCPTPVGRDGKVFLLSDRGVIHYIDSATGEDIWVDAIPRDAAKYYSSPILAGNLLYCAREDGVLSTVEVSETGMKVLAENEMGERLAAAPVPVTGKLPVRGVDHLFCIDGE